MTNTAKIVKCKWFKYVMLCAICYYLYNLKYVKNTQERELSLVKLQSKSLQLY